MAGNPIGNITSTALKYEDYTYHRRSVYTLVDGLRPAVIGRALHIGGGRDFWLLRDADQVVSLELDTYEGVDVVGDGCALPFPDDSFDSIVALEVLEHVPTPHIFLAEVRRVLRPGGRIILSTPFLWRIHRTPRDYWRFTPDSLELLFGEYASAVVLPTNGARETLLHFAYQYGELVIAMLGLPRSILRIMRPLEWIARYAIPPERRRDRSWATGWVVLARK